MHSEKSLAQECSEVNNQNDSKVEKTEESSEYLSARGHFTRNKLDENDIVNHIFIRDSGLCLL